MNKMTKFKRIILILIISILTTSILWINVSLNKSAFPLYKGVFQSYYGLFLAMILVLVNGSLINNYLYSCIINFISFSAGIYLKVNYYILPTFKKEESLIKFKADFFPYLDFLKNYFWLPIIIALIIGIIGTYISKISTEIDSKKDTDITFLNNTKLYIYICIFMSLSAVLCIKMNISISESLSVYSGLIIAFILVFIIGFLVKNYKKSIIISLIISIIGLFLKIKFYIVPNFKDDLILKSFKQYIFSSYINFLNDYPYILIIIFVTIGLIGTYVAKFLEKINTRDNNYNKNKKKFLDPKMMSYISVFVTMSVVVNILRIGGISFGGFPIIFSGFILGPLAGLFVGGISDVLSFIIRPTGQFNILFTLTSALTGAIPILVVRFLGIKNNRFQLWKVIIGIGIGQFVTTVVLSSFFVAVFMGTGKGFLYFATKALIKQSVSVPLYSVVLISLYESLLRSGVELDSIS